MVDKSPQAEPHLGITSRYRFGLLKLVLVTRVAFILSMLQTSCCTWGVAVAVRAMMGTLGNSFLSFLNFL